MNPQHHQQPTLSRRYSDGDVRTVESVPIFKDTGSGIDLNAPYTLPRTALVTKIFNQLQESNVAILRASSSCGKTSLLQLLEKCAMDNGYETIFVDCDGRDAEQSIDEFWEASTGEKVKDLLACTTPRIYLVDEVQAIYPDPKQDCKLWSVIKTANKAGRTKVQIFCCANYTKPIRCRGTTPFSFNVAYDESILYFTKADTFRYIDEYIKSRFLAKAPKLSLLVTTDLKEAVYQKTSGQPGLLHFILKTVLTVFGDASSQRNLPQHTLLRYLLSPRFLGTLKLKTCRGIARLDVLDTRNEEEKAKLISDLGEIALAGKTPWKDQYTPLMDLGFVRVVPSDDMMNYHAVFTSELQRLCTYQGLLQPAEGNYETLDELVLACLKRFRPSVLLKQLTDPRKEASWQNEFYHTCSTLLGSDVVITPEKSAPSPEGGDDKKGSGEVDFHLMLGEKVYLVEVLREGIKLDHHIDRFVGNGPYTRIPHDDYLVLDFRKTSNPPKFSEKLWRIEYSDDFKKLKIRTNSSKPWKIVECNGDMIGGTHKTKVSCLAAVMHKLHLK